ncbi:unnamed protein product [Ilex paraguariensis]|uniref:Uncharacterized protein n=1 Tax=Ilex paraguariensis TaxID=185542 RepID=A0ABC8TZS9_9AQUA
MAFHRNSYFTMLLILILIWDLGFRESLAMRPLDGEEWLQKNIMIQSLPRGSVPSSGSNPCTYIPGKSRGRCTLAENEMNFAGHSGHALPTFPEVMVHFAAAADELKGKVKIVDHLGTYKGLSSAA